LTASPGADALRRVSRETPKKEVGERKRVARVGFSSGRLGKKPTEIKGGG